MVIVIMGVSGVGKTTVGRLLAQELGWAFHDADDYHPPAAREQMRSGSALTDEQRGPWLAALASLVGEYLRDGRSMVLACSALRAAHRAALLAEVRADDDVHLIHLRAPHDVLADRLAERRGHFFPGGLLGSQLNTLEPPAAGEVATALTLDATRSPHDLVDGIRSALQI